MARKLIPYGYRPGNSPLHRLHAGPKLLVLIILSLCALGPDLFFLIPPVFIIVTASLVAGIRPWELFRGARPLFLLCLFLILFRSLQWEMGETPVFNRAGFWAGCRLGLMMFITFGAGALLFSTTTMIEIKDSLDILETALRGPHQPGCFRISLGISLMLGFIPRFFEVWENTELAWEARKGKKGIPRIAALVPLVTERMMAIAAETALALEARGF